jgi:diadenosine tetraphosphate (Ap4A) HIT family hydrolase
LSSEPDATGPARDSLEPARPRCPACAEIAGETSAPGGVVFENGSWFVSHHTGPYTDPGELIVKARRHCESLAELTREEGESLGPVLRSAVQAMERVLTAERTYVVSFNERLRHVHFLLLPRTREMPPGHVISDLYRRARNLLRKLGVLRNPSAGERAEVASRIRVEWRP